MPEPYHHAKRGKTMAYDNSTLQQAVHAVSSGMTIRVAAETFGIPKSTIGDRMSGKHDVNVKHGRPPAVPEEVETKLVNTVKMAAKMGVGLSRKQILQRTNVLCKRIKLHPTYKNFHAGKDWWEGVKRRHPDLVVRKPEKLTTVRARMMNTEVVQKYFKDLTDIVNTLNITQHPARIWNCDETGMNFEHTPVKVVAEKGERSVVSKTSTKSSNITVMACVNASGVSMPPMMIAKGTTRKCLHGFNTIEAPKGAMWAYQKSGWMSDDIGEKWFQDVFLRNCGPDRPQLLILDGHSSHESLSILESAMEEDIHILALPPHCTHYLQPLDRSVFGPLKTVYNQDCSTFMQEHPLHIINKWTFPTLFRGAWEKTVTPSNIKSGFQACGIVPLNPHAVPLSAFSPSDPTDVAATDDTHCENHNVPVGDRDVHLPVAGAQAAIAPDYTYVAADCTDSPSDPTDAAATDKTPFENHTVPVGASDVYLPVADTQAVMIVPDYTHGISQSHIQTDIAPHTGPVAADCALTLDNSYIDTTLPILDLSDPFMLSHFIDTVNNAIATNEVVVDSESAATCNSKSTANNDQAGNKQHNVFPVLAVVTPKCINAPKSDSVDACISSVFLPEKLTDRPIGGNKKRQGQTGHRLLTSEEIVCQKRLLQEKKIEKENRAAAKKSKK